MEDKKYLTLEWKGESDEDRMEVQSYIDEGQAKNEPVYIVQQEDYDKEAQHWILEGYNAGGKKGYKQGFDKGYVAGAIVMAAAMVLYPKVQTGVKTLIAKHKARKLIKGQGA